MEKYIYDNGLWYEREGDYYIPCSISEDPATISINNCAPSQVVDTETHTIGTWGKQHLTYLCNGKLNSPRGNYTKFWKIDPKIFHIYQRVCYNEIVHSTEQQTEGCAQ